MLRVLDLFSGIGGFSLGLERTGGFQTKAFCEIDPFCRRVLAKHWPDVPVHEDVRKLRGEDVGPVDVVCGGYPCQPFSHAGKRRGQEDDRHLWPEMRRLVDELRPAWVIGENVAGHIAMGLDDVLSDLESIGYACRAFVVPALAVGAPHQRYRVWIVAHAERLQCNGSGVYAGSNSEGSGAVPQSGDRGAAQDVADAAWVQPGREEQWPIGERTGVGGQPTLANANGSRLEGREVHREDACQRPAGEGVRSIPGEWLPEPNVGRVAHGVPSRVDRLRALGNAVVPQIPELIGRAILAAEAA